MAWMQQGTTYSAPNHPGAGDWQGPTAAQFNGSFSASSPDAAGIVAINGVGSFASQTAD
jgi:hypothetical protein